MASPPLGGRRAESFVIPASSFEIINGGSAVATDIDLTNNGTRLCRGIYIGTAGTIDVTLRDGIRSSGIPVTEFQTFPGLVETIHSSTATTLFAIY